MKKTTLTPEETFNHITLQGHVVCAPEYVGYSPHFKVQRGGGRMATLSVAVIRFGHNSDGEESRMADFHRLIARGTIATRAMKLKKGDSVLVRGALANRSYSKHDGTLHYVTEIDILNLSKI